LECLIGHVIQKRLELVLFIVLCLAQDRAPIFAQKGSELIARNRIAGAAGQHPSEHFIVFLRSIASGA
jgi:hypothetical protein